MQKSSVSFEKISDKYAFRIICLDVDDCYEAFEEGAIQGLEARQRDINYPQNCYNLDLRFLHFC